MIDLEKLGVRAKAAAAELGRLSDDKINSTLKVAARYLREHAKYLIEENGKDIDAAIQKGMTDAFIDRLTLNEKVIEGMAVGLEQVSTLKSPVGDVLYSYENVEQGINVVKKAVPFGVVGIIYESRPNVTADAFALCFKTANAVILKGGSDSLRSNVAIVNVLKQGLKSVGINENAISLIEGTSRQTTVEFMKMNKF